MVAKISSTSNLGGALAYNFHKVEAGEAKVLLVSGMSVDNNGNTDMNRALEDMQRLLPSSMRTKKTVFHASLNPHPDDKLSDEELRDIAAYYMEKMGYGSQPFIVFKHSDIEREHIHIVSLRVDSNGRKINDSHEFRRSDKVRKEIKRVWNLNTCKEQNIPDREQLQKADIDKGDIRKQIAGTVSVILKKYSFQSIAYNFHKVEAGEAKVLLVSGMSVDNNGNTDMNRALEDMQRLLPSSMRTKKTVFHASLNPHPDDKLSDEELRDIAAYYMEKMGYGSQPFIVFKHSDIEREHIHIVSLRVDSNGRKINDSHEFRRSDKVRKEIKRVWNLNTCKEQNIPDREQLQKADIDKGDIRKQIAGTVSVILKKYSFQSIGELNAVLSSYNIMAEEVKKEHNGKQYNGMVYSVTNSEGRKLTVPIDAAKLGRKYGYNAIHNHITRSKKEFKKVQPDLRNKVRKAMMMNPDRKEFVQMLKTEGIDVVFRENNVGRIYGITFIDHENGIVANGSRLGKGYAASVFNEYFNGNGDNPFLTALPQDVQVDQIIDSDTPGDDMITEMTGSLLDGTSHGIDYRELAFQRKMRRLYSGKLKRKK